MHTHFEELKVFLETGEELQIKGLGDLQVVRENEPMDNEYSETENKNKIVGDVGIYEDHFHTLKDDQNLMKSKNEYTHYENNELDIKIEEMIEKHESMFKCKVCGKTIKFKGEMKKHAETHIKGIYHSCQVCSKTFPTRHNLQTHILFAKDLEKPVPAGHFYD